jgi:hypothetical protein
MGFQGKPLAQTYPAMQVAYSTRNFTPLNVGGTAITYNSTSLLPAKGVAFDERQLPWDFGAVEDYTTSATFAPRLLLPMGLTNGVCIRPVFLGSTSGGGATDPRGKIAVMSIVQVHELSQYRPDTKQIGRVLQRNLLGQVIMTAEPGATAATIGAEVAGKLLNAADFALYPQRVLCDSIFPTGDNAFLPSGIVRVGMHSWAFDAGGASAIEFHVACVNAVTGTPVASVPAFAMFAQAIEL